MTLRPLNDNVLPLAPSVRDGVVTCNPMSSVIYANTPPSVADLKEIAKVMRANALQGEERDAAAKALLNEMAARGDTPDALVRNAVIYGTSHPEMVAGWPLLDDNAGIPTGAE